jgi:hypothetical protein
MSFTHASSELLVPLTAALAAAPGQLDLRFDRRRRGTTEIASQ